MSRRALSFFLISCLALLLAVPAAQAEFGFKDLSVDFEGPLSEPVTQAGSHPYAMTTTINMETILDAESKEVPEGALRDLEVELPEGFVGDPEAVPFCPTADFNNLQNGGYNTCPDAATIGVLKARLEPGPFVREFPVFLLEPIPGSAARIGFVGLNLPVAMKLSVDEEGPNAVLSSLTNITQAAPFYGADLTLWGNPADSSHDPERGGCLDRGLGTPPPREECPVEIEERPLITLPRNCTEPLITTFRARAWELGASAEGTVEEPPLTGCEELDFEAAIDAQPDTQAASSPAALDFSLDLLNPGLTDPEGLAASDIEATEVALPQGVTINPSQAASLAACSPAQLAAETATSTFGQGCPAGSSVGTVEVETPLLEGRTLEGHVFVATPFDNPFGTLIALYMTITEPEKGIAVKLAGEVTPIESGPETGRIIARFEDLPQLPFTHFRFHFQGGPRSALSTPERCGTYTTEALFWPTAAPAEPVLATSSFEVTSGPGGSPCPAAGPLPFSPSFAAGTANDRAATYSPFVLRLLSSDGAQPITRLDTVLPPGLTGKIAGIARCTDAAIAAAAKKSGRSEQQSPSCPASSRLGSTLAGAGVGPELTYVEGQVYLAGPYGSAPLSVVSIAPAVAGPFDLGTVVTRFGLDLNPITAEAEVRSSAANPIPTFLKGIPLRLRDLRVNLDRERFTLNASGCNQKTIAATLFGSPSLTQANQPYRASGCGALGFKPKLTLKLKGSTKRSGHPALFSTLVPRPGDSNIGGAIVSLPPSELIDNAHINNPCTRVQFNANQCPPASILGNARAITPLLDEPLEGPVYFRSNGGDRELPDIVADLHGTFDIVLVGFVDSVPVKGTEAARLRTRFLNVPDAPVTKFTLNLFGGKRGLLENNRNLCKHKLRSKFSLSGQNGRPYNTEPLLQTSCKKKKGGKGKKGK
jgi:hypothetical protein